MNKQFLLLLGLFTLGIIVGFFITILYPKSNLQITPEPSPTPFFTKENCLADNCLNNEIEFPVKELPSTIKDSLYQALDDEYNAYATYNNTISTFGNIRPFIMIARAEQQHIAALQALFDKYNLEIPENNYQGNIETSDSIKSACDIGVKEEKENIELFREKLLPLVTEYEDITAVYTNLMNASEQKHLPAFERCN